MTSSFQKISERLLENFSPRSKDIILRRFGLEESQTPETLESIGRDYSLSRERVRQIEKDALNKIKIKIQDLKVKPDFSQLESKILKELRNNGNLKREDKLFESLTEETSKNFVYFILTLSNSFQRVPPDEKFYALRTSEKNSVNFAKDICERFVKKFEQVQIPLTLRQLFTIYQKEIQKRTKIPLKENIFLSYLGISKEISSTLDGKFGLKTWPEVNPKTIKDKIFLVFKQEKKPLHFSEIASLIEELNKQLNAGEPGLKLAHQQTVHNELIKNPNFTLVGRGTYALKEWGYEPGQVKDIIFKVLKSSRNSLSKEEVIEAVFQQRLVKKSTILLNLQNKELFLRDEWGKYKIRET